VLSSFLNGDQRTALDKVVRLLLHPEIEEAVLHLARETNMRYGRGATAQPVTFWVTRVLLDSARTLDDLPLPAGSKITRPYRGFHIWAMSANPVAYFRAGPKTMDPLTVKDNRGFNFTPAEIPCMHITNDAQADEWFEVIFWH